MPLRYIYRDTNSARPYSYTRNYGTTTHYTPHAVSPEARLMTTRRGYSGYNYVAAENRYTSHHKNAIICSALTSRRDPDHGRTTSFGGHMLVLRLGTGVTMVILAYGTSMPIARGYTQAESRRTGGPDTDHFFSLSLPCLLPWLISRVAGCVNIHACN
jgi:hypothetical protein